MYVFLGQVYLKGGRPPHLDYLAHHPSGFKAGWCIWAYAAPAFFDLIDPNGLRDFVVDEGLRDMSGSLRLLLKSSDEIKGAG